MKEILSLIEQGKRRLEAGPFLPWLASESSPEEDRFAFLPGQAFLVLGFKDILSFVRIPEPKTALDFQVNLHCVEDTDHWVWYLDDLERLGFTLESWGPKATDVFRRLYSDENQYVRRIVYLSIHYVRQAKDPLISLVLIEILEAVFAAFSDHMVKRIHREGLYGKLEYYGRTHLEKEGSHALGAWTDDAVPSLGPIDYVLSDAQREQAKLMVSELFGLFEKLFDSWYAGRQSVHFYRRNQTDALRFVGLSKPAPRSV